MEEYLNGSSVVKLKHSDGNKLKGDEGAVTSFFNMRFYFFKNISQLVGVPTIILR